VWGYFTRNTEAKLIGRSLPNVVLEPLTEPHVGAILDAKMIVGRKPNFSHRSYGLKLDIFLGSKFTHSKVQSFLNSEHSSFKKKLHTIVVFKYA
jgi:hypothetical protein